MTVWYVYFRVGEPNKPADAGGFLRCDTQAELDEFIEQCTTREITFHVKEGTR